MNIRNLKIKLSAMGILGAAIIALVPALAPVGQASAAPVAIINICLSLAQNTCIIGQGPGHQVEISNTSAANFTAQNTNPPNGTWWRFTDGNGNCLREMTSNAVEMGNGSCNPSDLDAQWDWFSSGNPLTNKFRNRGQDNGNDYMGTYSTDNNKPVWAYPQKSGFNVGWVVKQIN